MFNRFPAKGLNRALDASVTSVAFFSESCLKFKMTRRMRGLQPVQQKEIAMVCCLGRMTKNRVCRLSNTNEKKKIEKGHLAILSMHESKFSTSFTIRLRRLLAMDLYENDWEIGPGEIQKRTQPG
jgi:hypothetical protein